jgi:DNA-binding NarL/FixJ family response regulator
MSVRAIIVDDHPIIRDTLVNALVSQGVFDEVASASAFRELIEMLERDAAYQLLILDLGLTDISGSDGLVYIREHFPDIPVVIFSASDSTDIITRCFENGIHGFISKNTSMQILVSAIRMVLAGGMYIPPAAVRRMGFDPVEESVTHPKPVVLPIQLTPKQREVFKQLLLGVPNKLIASRLGMAEGTVKTHLYVIYQTLGVNSRAQAILKARQLKLLD